MHMWKAQVHLGSFFLLGDPLYYIPVKAIYFHNCNQVCSFYCNYPMNSWKLVLEFAIFKPDSVVRMLWNEQGLPILEQV